MGFTIVYECMNMWKYFERQKNSQKEIELAIYGGVELTGEKKITRGNENHAKNSIGDSLKPCRI